MRLKIGGHLPLRNCRLRPPPRSYPCKTCRHRRHSRPRPGRSVLFHREHPALWGWLRWPGSGSFRKWCPGRFPRPWAVLPASPGPPRRTGWRPRTVLPASLIFFSQGVAVDAVLKARIIVDLVGQSHLASGGQLFHHNGIQSGPGCVKSRSIACGASANDHSIVNAGGLRITRLTGCFQGNPLRTARSCPWIPGPGAWRQPFRPYKAPAWG